MARKSNNNNDASSTIIKEAEVDPRLSEGAIITALVAGADAGGDLIPGPTVLRTDILVCLKDVITDQLPVRRADIGRETKPSKLARLDRQGWGTCLSIFEVHLRIRRAVYAFYDHKPRYTDDTFEMKFPNIVNYLSQRLVDQFTGVEP